MLDYKALDIGLFLKCNREALGIEPAYLAELLGVTRAAISKWENGAKSISLTHMALLSDMFGISVEDFINCNYQDEYAAKKIYDFKDTYFMDGTLNLKALQKRGAKKSFINTYLLSLNKMKELIKNVFLNDKNHYLLNSFLKLFGVKYNNKYVDYYMLHSFRNEISYDEFINGMTLDINMTDLIYQFIGNDDLTFSEYIKELSQEEKEYLLNLGSKLRVNVNLIKKLIAQGTYLLNDEGLPDLEKTLKLLLEE